MKAKSCNCKSEHCAHDGCEQDYWRVLNLILDELTEEEKAL